MPEEIGRKRSFHLRQIGFESFLEDNEEVMRVFRRPFSFAFVKMLWRATIWGGMAWILWFLYPERLFWGWIFVGGFAIFKVSSSFLHWYLNAILMTSENIIFVDWERPFQRRSTRIDYWNLDQVQTERIGFWAFFWNFGNLHFQKVNGGELIMFSNANRPVRTAKIIEGIREDMVDAKNFTEESALKNLLSQLVDRHVREEGQPVREAEKPVVEPPAPAKKPKKTTVESERIEVEKKLDDTGGIEFDLD